MRIVIGRIFRIRQWIAWCGSCSQRLAYNRSKTRCSKSIIRCN